MSDSEGEENYCSICYTNVIEADGKPVKSDDKITIEFECKHRFCSECVIETLKNNINNAEINKLNCFDYSCGQLISDEKLKEILTEHNLVDLYEKKKRFEEQKNLDKDKLVRWCPKSGCKTYVRAKDENDVHLTCPTCKTEICFKCRDVWHGKESCEKAMSR